MAAFWTNERKDLKKYGPRNKVYSKKMANLDRLLKRCRRKEAVEAHLHLFEEVRDRFSVWGATSSFGRGSSLLRISSNASLQ